MVNLAEVLVPYGIEADLAEGDLITDVLILAKVHQPDGTTALLVEASAGHDWIARLGMLAAATLISNQQQITQEDE